MSSFHHPLFRAIVGRFLHLGLGPVDSEGVATSRRGGLRHKWPVRSGAPVRSIPLRGPRSTHPYHPSSISSCPSGILDFAAVGSARRCRGGEGAVQRAVQRGPSVSKIASALLEHLGNQARSNPRVPSVLECLSVCTIRSTASGLAPYTAPGPASCAAVTRCAVRAR